MGSPRGSTVLLAALLLVPALRSAPALAEQRACAATDDDSGGASTSGECAESAAAGEVTAGGDDVGNDVGNEKVGSSRGTKGRAWKWIPEAQHRCNITRMTMSELQSRFGPEGLPPLYPHPLIIVDDPSGGGGGPPQRRRNAKFAEMTTIDNLPSNLPPDFEVTLSSSNSFSAHRRTIPLTQYLNETVNSETYPDQLSNETWYLFGETYGPGWAELLLNFDLPPCHTCTRELSALAFGIGNRGSGVQWHTHGPGFSEAVHGRKHWVLYPPERKPEYDSDYASRYWMETTYTSIVEEEAGGSDGDDLPHECTLEPGDMVYFPDRWHHATINLDPYTVFVSTFTTEHF